MMNYDNDDYEIRITKGYAKGGGYDMTGFSDAMDELHDMGYCIGKYVIPFGIGVALGLFALNHIVLPLLAAILY